jgi:integrase/recombinase XerD
MPYQYKREPLTPDEANRLASACETHQERFIVWTLLDTGLRVSELAGLTREHIDWQNHRLMIYGKGGIYGTKSKRRIIPLTDRIRPLIDGHFAIHDTIGMTPRTIQRTQPHCQQSPHQPPCVPPCAETHLCGCSRAEGYLPSRAPTALRA